MDPDATLRKAIEAMAEGDRDEAMWALQDLADWIRGGGFVPRELPKY